MNWAIKAAKWAAAILAAGLTLFLAYAIVTHRPVSDQWLYARGLEKLQNTLRTWD
jgi:hypothetical protein